MQRNCAKTKTKKAEQYSKTVRTVVIEESGTKVGVKANRKMNGNTEKTQEDEGGAKVNGKMVEDSEQEQAKKNEQGGKNKGVGM